MPTFETPEPITVTVDLGAAEIRVLASDRADTVVEVRPTDPARKGDVAAAEQTKVEYAGGQLLIKTLNRWKRYAPWGGTESVDVRLELPAGSRLQGEAGMGALRCSGRLGEFRFKTGLGEVTLDEVGPVQVKTGGGAIVLHRAAGDAELTTGTGAVQVDRIDGAAVIKNSNGDTWVGEVTGDLRASAANGKITVGQADASVAAKTANGDIRLGGVARGVIDVQTGYGHLEVAIRDGVAAWLELHTHFGTVRNSLDAAERPESGRNTIEVRAKTGLGDIVIRRCDPAAARTAAEES